jgi:hypothetical protein
LEIHVPTEESAGIGVVYGDEHATSNHADTVSAIAQLYRLTESRGNRKSSDSCVGWLRKAWPKDWVTVDWPREQLRQTRQTRYLGS